MGCALTGISSLEFASNGNTIWLYVLKSVSFICLGGSYGDIRSLCPNIAAAITQREASCGPRPV